MKDWDSYLEEVLKRCEAATPGPWEALDRSDYKIQTKSPNVDFSTIIPWINGGDFSQTAPFKDFNFMAEARTDLPRLARYCQKLREALKISMTHLHESSYTQRCRDGATETPEGKIVIQLMKIFNLKPEDFDGDA